MSNRQQNNRQYFRLVYPTDMTPSIKIGDHVYPVPEISEGGIRVQATRFPGLVVGDEVVATLFFDDGDELDVSGVVYRQDKQDYIIAPLIGISFKRIVKEQRKLLNRYPTTRS